jgi:hypothetical protein
VNVKEAGLLDGVAGGILRQAGNVDDAETRCVVGLVGEAVEGLWKDCLLVEVDFGEWKGGPYVLVVVDRLFWRLVETGVYGGFEVADVEDVGRGMVDQTTELARGRAGLVQLVELVVEKEGGHGFVDDPALVRVGVADVGGLADDDWVLLVGCVVDGEGVFVVAEADFLAEVLLVRAAVDDTLCIMNIACLTDAAGRGWVAGVGHVDHEHATGACGVAGVGTRTATDGVDHVNLGVGDKVVRCTEAVKVGGQIPSIVENDRVLGVNVEKLVQIEDLQAVVVRLGTDVGVVLDDLDVSPADGLGVSVQSAEEAELALLADFDKCNAVSVSYNAKLAALLGSPAPDIVASLASSTQVFVADEVQKVDVFARVLASHAVLALGRGGALLVSPVAIEGTGCSSLLPGLGLERHHFLHGCGGGHSSGAEQAGGQGSGELHVENECE